MSDIIAIRKNILGQFIVRTRETHMNHQEALDYVKTFPEYHDQLGLKVKGVTVDDFWPLDDSDEYVGYEPESESMILVTSNPDSYCNCHTLKLLLEDGSLENLHDIEGNEIHGLLEAD